MKMFLFVSCFHFESVRSKEKLKQVETNLVATFCCRGGDSQYSSHEVQTRFVFYFTFYYFSVNMPFKWTNELSIQLIELYKGSECLWNASDEYIK